MELVRDSRCHEKSWRGKGGPHWAISGVCKHEQRDKPLCTTCMKGTLSPSIEGRLRTIPFVSTGLTVSRLENSAGPLVVVCDAREELEAASCERRSRPSVLVTHLVTYLVFSKLPASSLYELRKNGRKRPRTSPKVTKAYRPHDGKSLI